MMNRYDYKISMKDIEERGIGIGEVRGLKKAARNMLKDGLALSRVARITNLPLETIKALQ